MKQYFSDIAVLGAGSAGFAAAFTLASAGVSVVLVDKNPGPGGTSVFGGVNCWEPGVCKGNVHLLLAERLSAIPDAAAERRIAFPGKRLFGFFPISLGTFRARSRGKIRRHPLPLSVAFRR